VGQFLDLKSPHTIKDVADSSGSLDPIFFQKIVQKHKSGLDILLGYPNYYLDSRGFPDFPALDKILQNLRSSYQWICLDLGSWLDPLYFRLLQKADQLLLLTQLTVPDLQNLKAIKVLFRELNIEDQKVKIVVNNYTKDYSLGLKDVETIGRQPVFTTIPHDYLTLMEAINQGIPLGEAAPRSKLWRRLLEMAKNLVEEQAQQNAKVKTAAPHNGLFHRLFL
jgi:pilus assembly protein CpaE